VTPEEKALHDLIAEDFVAAQEAGEVRARLERTLGKALRRGKRSDETSAALTEAQEACRNAGRKRLAAWELVRRAWESRVVHPA
jgi:hypothetical protein